MMSFRRLAASALAVALLAIPLAAMLFLTGCRKQEKVFVDSNLAPDTRLTRAPGPYSQANYRIHLYWDGTDPDGYVVAYHYAWDDTVPPFGAPGSPWHLTSETDSLFKALIDTVGETKRHTFYVRAVDNEGKLDPSAAKIRFDAYTARPEIDYLYRVDGPMDPDMGTPDPAKNDTVLMRTPVTFKWEGHDPDGMGAPITYSYRLDSNPDSPFGAETTKTIPSMGPGTHIFYVKAKDETGAQNFPEDYKFVMNFAPDSQITSPNWHASGDTVVADTDTIWFFWEAHDKEQLEGAPGRTGVAEIWIELDSDFQERIEVDSLTGEYLNNWYFTSTVPISDPHYIKTDDNNAQGGNRMHTFRIWSKDVEGTFERPSDNPEDGERFDFWYNRPPESDVLFPAPGDTVGPEFEVLWQGEDGDGEVAAYQYVLDPSQNAYRVCQVTPEQECTSREYTVVNTLDVAQEHDFRLRAQDNSGCWELSWNRVNFFVAPTPRTTITLPEGGGSVCSDFTAKWSGNFRSGGIAAYEYVLDPGENEPVVLRARGGEPATSAAFKNMTPGRHVLRVRAQSDEGHWAWPWTEVEFTVEECN
jgi:hypothetical protein